MIVYGFIEPIVKELPLEYAVEMNRLIQLQMEGRLANPEAAARKRVQGSRSGRGHRRARDRSQPAPLAPASATAARTTP